MLNAAVDGLRLRPGGVYVDATYGGGGHSGEILNRLEGGRLIAFDQDSDALENATADPRLILLNQNFRFLRNNLLYHGFKEVNGILADLGVSFHQFDTMSRGFSFRGEGPLDMRMNRESDIKASDIVNNYSEEQLASLFYRYGDIRCARPLAAAVVSARKQAPLTTVSQLVRVATPFLPQRRESKFLAQMFQAIRIEVNRELDALTDLLEQACEMLAEGGRLVVITYHSAEDRLVKNFMRSGTFDGVVKTDFYGNRLAPFRSVTRGALRPESDEVAANPRSRSARMRIAEKRSDYEKREA